MKYQGTFLDVNGNYHTLVVGSTGDTVDLKFGESPFVTSMAESDMLYTPVKCQAGTIGLVAVGTNYMFGLYTGDAHGMPVTLYSGQVVNPATIEWVGYVTPSLYDIGYTKYLEELDVDCVDGLATLESYKYKPIGTTAGIHSLLDIVRHCIAKCGCYNIMVLSTASRLSSTDTRNLWYYCYMTERNFIAQDTNATDGEDDKTYKEVLEAICQWVGVTCVAKGDTVYFIDYDALLDTTGNTSLIVDVASGTLSVSNLNVNGYTIDGSSYADSGSKLSLDKVYTKVTIKDELNEFDDIFGDIFENAINVTVDDATLKQTKLITSQIHSCADYHQPGTGDNILYAVIRADYNGGFNVNYDNVDGYNLDSWENIANAIFLKYYKSNSHTIYHYTTASGNPSTTADIDACNYTMTRSINGGFLVRFSKTNIENANPHDWSSYSIADMHTLDGLLMVNGVHDVSYDDYIFFINHRTNHIANANAANFPFIKLTATVGNVLFGGSQARLLISGDIFWHPLDGTQYPLQKDVFDFNDGRRDCTVSDCYLLCQLKWGSYYWTGKAWQTTATNFRLPYAEKTERYDKVMFEAMPVQNTVSWKMGIDGDGYVVTVPRNVVLDGMPELTIYKPMDMGSYYETRFMAIKGLKVETVTADPLLAGDMDDDTVYTNIIDTNNAEEMEEQTFTVCTYDGKKASLSPVAYIDHDVYQWVDKTYHVAMAADETGDTLHDGTISDGHQRQEEHMLHRLVNQYSEPAKVLSVTLHADCVPHQLVTESNLDTTFVIDKVDVDYKAQTFTYKLIEKK